MAQTLAKEKRLLQILGALARLLTPLGPFCFWVMGEKAERWRRLAWWAAGWLRAFGWLSGEFFPSRQGNIALG